MIYLLLKNIFYFPKVHSHKMTENAILKIHLDCAVTRKTPLTILIGRDTMARLRQLGLDLVRITLHQLVVQ
jgi:hypothetical protein